MLSFLFMCFPHDCIADVVAGSFSVCVLLSLHLSSAWSLFVAEWFCSGPACMSLKPVASPCDATTSSLKELKGFPWAPWMQFGLFWTEPADIIQNHYCNFYTNYFQSIGVEVYWGKLGHKGQPMRDVYSINVSGSTTQQLLLIQVFCCWLLASPGVMRHDETLKTLEMHHFWRCFNPEVQLHQKWMRLTMLTSEEFVLVIHKWLARVIAEMLIRLQARVVPEQGLNQKDYDHPSKIKNQASKHIKRKRQRPNAWRTA